MKYLEKFIPDYDKLKHFFIGTLAFIGLDFFLDTLTSLVILFLFLWAWELIQKERGGTNTWREMFKDIFFGLLTGLIINVLSLF